MSRYQPSPIVSDLTNLPEAITYIKQQIYDLKLLNNDNKLKSEQIIILTEKLQEAEYDLSNYRDKVSELEDNFASSKKKYQSRYEADQEELLRLQKNNETLSQTNRQLKNHVNDLEESQHTSQEEYKGILEEIKELQHRSNQAQQAMIDSRELLNRKQEELDETRRVMEEAKNQGRILRSQNEEVLERILNITNENVNLDKLLQNNEKRLMELEEKHKAFNQVHMEEMTEYNGLKHSFDSLKRSYDELKYDYNNRLAEHKQDRAQVKAHATRLNDMEGQIERLQKLLEQKDDELCKKKKTLVELEHKAQKGELTTEVMITKALSLIEDKTIELNTREEIDSASMKELLEKIIVQNRRLADLKEAEAAAREEFFYGEKELTKLAKENGELRQKNEELMGGYEELEREMKQIVEGFMKEKQELQGKVGKDLENLTSILCDSEKKFEKALESKEDEVLDLLEEREKLRDRIADLERGIKELKGKLLVTVEDASLQKGKLGRISCVIATFVRVFMNLLTKYRALGKQKDFLTKYFWEYQTLKQSLVDIQLLKAHTDGRYSQNEGLKAIKKFKRAILVVRTVVKLRRSQKKRRNNNQGNLQGVLESISNKLKGFMGELFMGEGFGLEKSVVDIIEDVLKGFDGLNESAIVGKIIVNTEAFRSFQQEFVFSGRHKRSSKDYQVTGVSFGLEITKNLTERVDSFKEKLQSVEDENYEKEQQYKRKLEDTMRRLEDAEKEIEVQKRHNENVMKEFNHVRDEVLGLMDWMSDNRGSDMMIGSKGQEVINLYERVNGLQENRRNEKERSIWKTAGETGDRGNRESAAKLREEYRRKSVESGLEDNERVRDFKITQIENYDEYAPEFRNLSLSNRSAGRIMRFNDKKSNGSMA